MRTIKVLIHKTIKENQEGFYEARFDGDELKLVELWEKGIFPFEDSDLKLPKLKKKEIEIISTDIDSKNIFQTIKIFRKYPAIIFEKINLLIVKKFNSGYLRGAKEKFTMQHITNLEDIDDANKKEEIKKRLEAGERIEDMNIIRVT
jgi:hypothetical protein